MGQGTAVLAQVRDAVDAVLGVPAWQLPAGDVAALVEGLAVEASRLAAAQLRLLAEAEERRVGTGSGFITTGAWLTARTRCRLREAGSTVALATALTGHLAPTAAALAAGAMTQAHAAVVHRVMTKVVAALAPPVVARPGEPELDAAGREAVLREAQEVLVEHATRLDPDQLAVAGRHLLARLSAHRGGPGEDAAHERALEQAGLTLVQTDDGTWFLRATLDPVGGATLAAALDAGSAPAAAGPDGSRDRRSAPQRRAAALVQLADERLAALPGGTRTRPRVTVTVEATTLADPWAHGAAPGELTAPGCGDAHGGHPLPPGALAAVVCDADVVPVLVGPGGAPLDVGRTVYAFPERVRTAIVARDRGCTFPHACGRPAAWCQVHHLLPFSAGGATSERNGALVCTPAHLLVHRRGWTARLDGDRVLWTPPRAARTAGRGQPPPELARPPSWKPDLDRVVATWRQHLTWAPSQPAVTDTG